MKQIQRFFSICLFVTLDITLAPASFAQSGSTAASDGAWKAVQAAAQKEGRVVLYSQAGPGIQARLEAGFAKENPTIKLEVVRVTGAAVVAKVDQERQINADGADVVITTVIQWLEKSAREGAMKAPVGPASRSWPKEYLLQGAAPVLSIDPIVMAYNTNLVKTPIAGYEDLLRPDLKGKIGTLLPSSAPSVVAWYDFLEEVQGTNFMTSFAAQAPRFYASSVPVTQALASGEVAVAAFTLPNTAGPLIEKGAPIRLVVPKRTLGVQFAGAILGFSKRPNAAQVLMDYLISVQGQTAYSGRGESASPIHVPGSQDPRTVTAYDESRYTPEVVKKFNERWNQRFNPN
jgi:iron(III) transport system substrate-binding protein